MNILQAIRIGIALVVLIVSYLAFRWLILPHMKVFFPSLPPGPFWISISNAFTAVCHQAIPFILIPLVVLYFLYKIISKIPLIGKILIRIPPFPDLKRSGVIGLFDGIFGIIFSRRSLKDRFINLAQSILGFIQGSFKNSADAIDDAFHIKNKLNAFNPKLKIPDSISLTTSTVYQPSPDDNAPVENPLMTDEQKEVDDKYQMCLKQNVKVITPDMSQDDIQYYTNQNSIESVRCQVQKLQTSLSFVTNPYLQ